MACTSLHFIIEHPFTEKRQESCCRFQGCSIDTSLVTALKQYELIIVSIAQLAPKPAVLRSNHCSGGMVYMAKKISFRSFLEVLQFPEFIPPLLSIFKTAFISSWFISYSFISFRILIIHC